MKTESLCFCGEIMRYHYEKPTTYNAVFGTTYICDHPVYNRCTLYKIGKKGLAVIQQRYDAATKATTWTEIDPWLINEIYLHTRFKKIFDEKAGVCVDNIYPTVTVRQLMWSLRMKPVPREPWETYFDRKTI